MKAIQIQQTGGPEVLDYVELETSPPPAKGRYSCAQSQLPSILLTC